VGYPDHGHLIFDAAGNLYGVTAGWYGGASNGTVFKLTPNSDGTWTQSVLITSAAARTELLPKAPWLSTQQAVSTEPRWRAVYTDRDRLQADTRLRW